MFLAPFGVGGRFSCNRPPTGLGTRTPDPNDLELGRAGVSFLLMAWIKAPELVVPAMKETLGSACRGILEDCRHAVPLKETCPVLPVPVQVPGMPVFF